MTHSALYRGRFAPSPTGPLHLGSLIAALASYLDARAHNGRWLLRVEDIDPPREQPGAKDDILRALDAFGLHWDGQVLYQSSRIEAYREALDQLSAEKMVYACTCSRRDIIDAGKQNLNPLRYPGNCRHRKNRDGADTSLRVITGSDETGFNDRIFQRFSQRINSDVGDFIVRRRDGLVAYHLAVVVDDAWQGITDIVRGSDLLDSTPRQIYLQKLLEYQTPRYMHIPVALDQHREKMSKQTGAAPLSLDHVSSTLLKALRFLRQSPDMALAKADRDDILHWAIDHWNPQSIEPVPGMVVKDKDEYELTT